MSTRRRQPDPARVPRLVVLSEPKGRAYPAGRMLIASPDTIAGVVQRIPRGRVLRLGALRASLAAAHGADYTCAMTTGIFLRMLAEDVDRAAGIHDLPWWRVVRDDGALLETLPGGAAAQQRRLAQEGLLVTAAKRPRVCNVADVAWTP